MQYGTSYLYTNVPELSSDIWHKHHVPAVDKVLFAPSLQQRCWELEGAVFSPKKHDSLWIPWKAESSKHTIFLRKKALTHFVVIFLPAYSHLPTFPPTVLRNSLLLFSSQPELHCKGTECRATALATPQVAKTNNTRTTDAARNGAHKSTNQTEEFVE